MRFPHVFKEGKIGELTLKNRIIMPGMSTGLASPDGEVTDQLIRYYKEISRYLEKLGVDAIHASCGNYNSIDKVIESPIFEQGWRVYLAEAIKEVVQIPVIAVGNIREPKYVDNLLSEGKADFIALGRAHIADPEWCNKALEGREKEIRMCISCLHCTYTSSFESTDGCLYLTSRT
ncbi:MAG: hypothetical protein GX072_02320 [Lysinibacillus sp.]|nr:hypothetical protein [Lysinibacillus sp.]